MDNNTESVRDALAGRYRLGAELGRGGFGTVFRAVDAHTQSPVAIKRLSVPDPTHLVHFKREFRLLADCRHAHLVRYEALIEDEGDWYLVMEFIDGVDVVSFVREGGLAQAEADASDRRMPTPRSGITVADWLAGPDTQEVAVTLSDITDEGVVSSLKFNAATDVAGVAGAAEPLTVTPPTPEMLARVRTVLVHLANGLAHLHAQGLVHRDLKPRNILVSRDGRPVILDFGLVSRSRGDRVGGGLGFRVGTPRYMAPEQALGRTVTPAADWYALGVMLYEMLTGVPPLRGAPFAVMATKTSVVPADPRTLVPDLPADLCALCMELLAIDPEQRPTDVVARLSQGVERTPLAVEAISSGIFVGRSGPLARLESALTAVQDDARPRMVLLRGPSGIGKSALMQTFARRSNRRQVVLRGRCFQREAVPFKALDSLADALLEHVLAQQGERLPDFPERVGYLAQVVPVLRMIPAIDALAMGIDAQLDPHERRRRAFAALREWFAILSEGAPLVVTVDDVQWCDQDSVTALVDALTPAQDLRVLFVATQRSDEQSRGVGPAEGLVQGLVRAGMVVDVIDVGPLAETEATELAKLLPRSQAWRSPGVLYRESGGHPMLLRELARALPGNHGESPTLTALLARRLEGELDAEGRRLMEALAVAGQPRRPELVRRVVGAWKDLGGTIERLRALNLLRWHGSGAALAVGCYHDKVVETVLASLSPENLADWHRRWAEAFGRHPDAEAEAVCEHWIAAGDARQAFSVGLTAARRAGALLAFDRAAALYQRLIAIAPPDADTGALRLARADALAAAGQGAASALAYTEAADDPACRDQAHARSRAAGQYLRSGHIDAGVSMARRVLESFDLGWRRSSGTALVSLLWHQARLRLRGFEFVDRLPHQIPATQVVRMDALWQLGHGLGGVDTIRGAEFHARHLLMALDVGDPYRVSRALAWEGLLAAAEGGQAGYVRAECIIARGRAIAERLSHPHAQAWNLAGAGYTAYAQGQFAAAVQQAEAGMRLYRDRCLDVTWEMGSLYCWCWFPALWFSGRIDDLRTRLAAVENEFDGLGDLYTVVSLRTVIKPWLHLLDGRPELAVQEAITEVARWSRQHWHLQHLFARFAEVRAALYQGDGQLALHLLDDAYPRFRSSLQARLQGKRIFFQALRGQAALCAWRQNAAEFKRYDRVVRDAIRRLERERHPWATVHVLALRAGWQACLGGDAIGGWHQADAAFAAQNMPLYAAACRLRSGQAKAADELVAYGVRDPERFALMAV